MKVFFFALDELRGVLEMEDGEFTAAPESMLSVLDEPIYLRDGSALWADESPEGFMDGLQRHYKSPYFRASAPQGGAFNQFCPTGPGGGVDPTCKSDGGGAKFVGQLVGAKEHEAARRVSVSIAHMLGGVTEEKTSDPGQRDKKPYDVQVKKESGPGFHDVEVKSLLKGEKQSISVHEDALLRKVEHSDAHPDNTFHTVVRDERKTYEGGAHKDNYSGHDLYYKRGSGRYSLSQMYPVKDSRELKRLLDTPDHLLPEKARGSLPPPPPIDRLRERAAAAHEARYARDTKRKARARR